MAESDLKKLEKIEDDPESKVDDAKGKVETVNDAASNPAADQMLLCLQSILYINSIVKNALKDKVISNEYRHCLLEKQKQCLILFDRYLKALQQTLQSNDASVYLTGNAMRMLENEAETKLPKKEISIRKDRLLPVDGSNLFRIQGLVNKPEFNGATVERAMPEGGEAASAERIAVTIKHGAVRELALFFKQFAGPAKEEGAGGSHELESMDSLNPNPLNTGDGTDRQPEP